MPEFWSFAARLCPISFASCPFPNLAGTPLQTQRRTSENKNEGSYIRLAAAAADDAGRESVTCRRPAGNRGKQGTGGNRDGSRGTGLAETDTMSARDWFAARRLSGQPTTTTTTDWRRYRRYAVRLVNDVATGVGASRCQLVPASGWRSGTRRDRQGVNLSGAAAVFSDLWSAAINRRRAAPIGQQKKPTGSYKLTREGPWKGGHAPPPPNQPTTKMLLFI